MVDRYGILDVAVNTVKVEIFARYIFSRIWRRVLDVRKYDASEKIYCYNLIRINC